MAEAAIPPDLSFRPTRQGTPSFEVPRPMPGVKRLSMTGWAMMRDQGGPDSLAGRGMLGGSEAGARLMWHVTPSLAATLRSSAPVNSQGARRPLWASLSANTIRARCSDAGAAACNQGLWSECLCDVRGGGRL